MGRREDNKREKRSRLLEAAGRGFATQGYDRASIEQIAKDAGVARGTYYLYFPDKLAIFHALVAPWIEDLLTLVGEVDQALMEAPDAAAAYGIYERMGMAIALIGLNNRDTVLLAFRENRGTGEAGQFLRDQESALLRAFAEMSARARDRGWIRVADPRLTVRVIFGAVERLTFDVLTGEDLGDPELLSAEVVRLFTSSMGLQADPG